MFVCLFARLLACLFVVCLFVCCMRACLWLWLWLLLLVAVPGASNSIFNLQRFWMGVREKNRWMTSLFAEGMHQARKPDSVAIATGFVAAPG